MSSTDKLKAMIREAGLRSTAPRLAVLRHMEALSAPSTHADVVEALKPHGFDRATIYRNLIDLTDVGLLSRVNLGDNVWYFEARTEVEHPAGVEHPHFVCNDCGAVSCLDDVKVEIKPVGTGAVVAEIHEVLLKGRCASCLGTGASSG